MSYRGQRAAMQDYNFISIEDLPLFTKKTHHLYRSTLFLHPRLGSCRAIFLKQNLSLFFPYEIISVSMQADQRQSALALIPKFHYSPTLTVCMCKQRLYWVQARSERLSPIKECTKSIRPLLTIGGGSMKGEEIRT
jgi:hypothetical protein